MNLSKQMLFSPFLYTLYFCLSVFYHFFSFLLTYQHHSGGALPKFLKTAGHLSSPFSHSLGDLGAILLLFCFICLRSRFGVCVYRKKKSKTNTLVLHLHVSNQLSLHLCLFFFNGEKRRRDAQRERREEARERQQSEMGVWKEVWSRIMMWRKGY